MKKYLFLMLSVFFLFSSTITAQDGGKKSVNISEKRVEKLASELGLNEAEKAQVKALLEKQSVEVKKMKSEISPEGDNFRVKMKELHKAHEEELKKVIGKEKFAKYKENRAQEKQKIENTKAKM